MPNLQQRFRQFALQWGERVLDCNDQECTRRRRAWQRLSNGAGSVRLHGLRYCFPGCFERALQRRLERMQWLPPARGQPRHRLPLGLLMLSRGDLTSSQLRCTLETQQRHGGLRIGEWMQELGFVREPQVTAALAMQWSCPVLKNLPQSIAECLVPFYFLRHFQMVPAHFAAGTRVLHLAFADDIDYPALVAIEQMLDCKTETCLTTASVLKNALDRMEEEPHLSEKVFPGARGGAEVTRITSCYVSKLAAIEVQTAVCRELGWVRIRGDRGQMNLLFPAQAGGINSV